MLNRTKRDERKAKKKLELEERAEQQAQLEYLRNDVRSLKLSLDDAGRNQSEADKNADILHQLFIQKVIDSDGKLLQ